MKTTNFSVNIIYETFKSDFYNNFTKLYYGNINPTSQKHQTQYRNTYEVTLNLIGVDLFFDFNFGG